MRPVRAAPVPDALTYAPNGRYVRLVLESSFEAAVVRAADIGMVDTERRSFIIHRDPTAAFFSLHIALLNERRYGALADERGAGVEIAPSAVVHHGVQIGDDARIEEGAVVYPNTLIGEGATIHAGAVVGGEGLQVAQIDDRPTAIPSAGGVALGAGTTIGTRSCIDRGLFSTLTALGAGTMLDGLVQVGADATVGARCTIGAGAVIATGAALGDDVFYGPGCVGNPFVRLGRGVLATTGSVLVCDADPFTMMRGNPAAPAGQVCLCRTPLVIGDEWVVRCPSCGREYTAPRGVLSPL
jgi:UDP-3-O-[3-hydroxymyristoyl] glucosamine N-acyltransferase